MKILANIEFEAIVHSTKKYFLYQRMVDFLNKLDLSYQKYQANGNVRRKHYKGKLLFPMKGFVPFGTDHQSMYFMSTRFLKDHINGVHVPQFQIAYIFETTCPPHKHLVKLCWEVHNMWWVNQYLGI